MNETRISLREAMEIAIHKTKKLSPGQKIIVLSLIYLMDESNRDHVIISMKELGDCCELSARTIYRLMWGLEARGVVKITPRSDGKGRHFKNKYEVNGYSPKKELDK